MINSKANINLQDDKGLTPLHECVEPKKHHLAQLLLEHGAVVSIQDKTLVSPLHKAVEVGNLPPVNLLLGLNAPVNQANEYGQTALHLCCASKYPDLEMLTTLIKHDADINQRTGRLLFCSLRSHP